MSQIYHHCPEIHYESLLQVHKTGLLPPAPSKLWSLLCSHRSPPMSPQRRVFPDRHFLLLPARRCYNSTRILVSTYFPVSSSCTMSIHIPLPLNLFLNMITRLLNKVVNHGAIISIITNPTTCIRKERDLWKILLSPKESR